MLVTHRIRGLFSLFVIVQLLAVSVGFWLHLALVRWLHTDVAEPERYVVYFLLVLAGLLAEAAYRYQVDATLLQRGFVVKHRTAVVQALVAAAPVFFFLVATKDAVISRVFLFSFGVVLHGLLLATSHYIPPLLARFTFHAGRRERTLLVGAPRRAASLQVWVARKAELGIEPAGLLTDAAAGREESPFPILGGTDDLERVIREKQITQVLVVEFPATTDLLTSLTDRCERLGVRLLVVSDLEERFRHRIVYSEDDGVRLIGLREEPLENPFNRALKRALDLAVAAPVIVLILPWACALVWLLQRLQSPGPLLITQARAGIQNRAFAILKFRTMHPENPDPARQAVEGDSRIYRAGRWLRRMSVDELPQFVNVLRGEMSVVGPRPHLPEHNEQWASVMGGYHVRTLVKPGITGLAQVRGFRGEARTPDQINKRVESDVHYLENWSLMMDVMVIFRTAWQVFFPPDSAR
jgi:exopolysaccharide biosynthesis polyprenyl glycosylphosphotransferase